MSRGARMVPVLTMLFAACDSDTAETTPNSGLDEQWVGEAVTTIGRDSGAAPYLFEDIGGAFLVGDSNIVVVDRGSREIRRFARDGSHELTFAGMGSGPGELMSPFTMWLNNDTLVVWDVLLGRASAFRSDGTLLNVASVSTSFTPIPVGRFADGSFLIVRPASHAPMAPGGVQTEPALLYRLRLDDSTTTLIGTVPWEPMAAGTSARDPARSMYVSQPFGRTTSFAVGDTFFYTTDGSSWTIYKWDMRGALIDSLVIARDAPVQITATDRQNWIAAQVAGADPDYRAQVRRFVSSLTLPAHYPTTDALLLDADQNLWVKTFATDSTRNDWLMIESDGTVLTAGMPQRFRPTMIGQGHLVGIATDSLDIERVVVYRLIRPDRDRA